MSQPSQNPTTPKAEFTLGYRPELDGVRAISILLVLCLHLLGPLIPGGYLGVDIFFVLSGFLITSLLLQEWRHKGSISLKDFYIRRALRLGPALITYLLLLGLFALVFLKRDSAKEIYAGILLTLSYVSNWVIALKPEFPVGILAITWSLAIEEQFYLIWPLILFTLLSLKVKSRWILLALMLGFALITIHRRMLWEGSASVRRLYYGTDTHADGLLLGCLVGCLVSWNIIPKTKLLVLGMKSLAMIAAVFIAYLALTTRRDNAALYAGGFSLASMAIAVMLTVVLLWPPTLVLISLRFKPLAWIGRISYGLYLWHWPVRGFVFGKSMQPSNKQILAATILAFLIAALSYYLIEKPFLTWKRHFSHA